MNLPASDPLPPFEVLIATHRDMVLGTAVRLLDNQAEAQDVAQEVFLRLWRHYPDRVRARSVAAWLRTVTRNLCNNHLGRYRARCKTFTDLTANGWAESDTWGEYSSVDTADSDRLSYDRRALISGALVHLKPGQRAALELFHLDEIAYPEIARRLGITPGKAKTDAFRGRASLRKRLETKRDSLGV